MRRRRFAFEDSIKDVCLEYKNVSLMLSTYYKLPNYNILILVVLDESCSPYLWGFQKSVDLWFNVEMEDKPSVYDLNSISFWVGELLRPWWAIDL